MTPERTASTERPTTGDRPGSEAGGPTDLPREGWKQVLGRTKDEIQRDNVALMAAGVAFYAMLAIFPALIAAVSLWGLVADPAEVERMVAEYAGALPQDAADLVEQQVERIAETSPTALGWTLVASVLGALWSASAGMKGLMNAVNEAYDETETRGFLRLRGIALLLTLGGIVFALLTIGLIAVVPVVLGLVNLGGVGEALARWGRWPVLALAVVAALAVLYRFAPDRDDPRWQWASVGSILATVLWLVASAAFAVYVNLLGEFAGTYGALAGVIVLMLWFFLSAFAVLVGAELNAETEHQTRRDTTRGPDEPMGERGAHVADTRPDRP